MFRLRLPFVKEGSHADDRLAERTNLSKDVLSSLRKDIKRTPIPYGSHHVVLDDGSYAVLKDVSTQGRKKHVVATILGPEMSPPGTDITRSFRSTTKGRNVYIHDTKGKGFRHQHGSEDMQSKSKISGRFGSSTRKKVRDSLNRIGEAGKYEHKKIPGGYASSQSYSFSSTRSSR